AIRPGATGRANQGSGECVGAAARRDALAALQPKMRRQTIGQSRDGGSEVAVPPPPIDFLEIGGDLPSGRQPRPAHHAGIRLRLACRGNCHDASPRFAPDVAAIFEQAVIGAKGDRSARELMEETGHSIERYMKQVGALALDLFRHHVEGDSLAGDRPKTADNPRREIPHFLVAKTALYSK